MSVSLRWYTRLGLILLSVAMLSLALAPVYQFYFAWVGLVPMFAALTGVTSGWRAFAWGFAGGWVFFLVNMWWLWFVSPPGLFALTLYLAIFWGFAAVVIRALLNDPRPILAVFLIALSWTGFEWIRGNVSFLGRQGLPWLYLGQTQSPMLVMCQIADIIGVLGVTFWLILLNATIALAILRRAEMRRMIPVLAITGIVVIAIGIYGAFRVSQDTLRPGPTVLVVQANYKQSNTGEKGAPISEIAEFHVNATRRALAEANSRGQQVDLVVWSETMMPPINPEATKEMPRLQQYADVLAALAKQHNLHLLAGGVFYGGWTERDGNMIASDRRNSAYLFTPSGELSDKRYDKVHLVPFGEYIPFQHSIPPLYRLFIHLGPQYYEEYVLTRGSEFTVFQLNDSRFVVPICFEDIVPSLVASMLRGEGGTKRADFLVNITNDGWFRANQMPQHLQAAVFRSIENRVPTARSVNTGISGFIDPVGRVSNTVPAETEGTSLATLSLDSRVTFYTRAGDVFALTCVGGTMGVVGWMIVTHLRYKSHKSRTTRAERNRI